jgi:hypothetical protein
MYFSVVVVVVVVVVRLWRIFEWGKECAFEWGVGFGTREF